MKEFKNYICGQFVNASGSFESVNPATGEAWARMPAANVTETQDAISAAESALQQNDWTSLSATKRGKLLHRLADLLEKKSHHFAQLDTLDSGKPIRETTIQTAYIAEFYRYYGGLADKLEGTHLPIDHPDTEVWLQREPKGVVAAIVPWNSPLFLSAVKIGPAIAAGCTIVIKASEDAPAPMLEFAKLVNEAEFPPGVINIICGFGENCGKTLSSDPRIAHIAFTGGPETARHIVRNSAVSLASTSLELGGKSPFVVFDDADIESAVNAQLAAIFMTSGQSCVAGSRLIISKRIKDQFIDQLSALAKRIVIGDPMKSDTQMGPLCTMRQLNNINRIVSESIASGATLITGGKQLDRPGQFYEPTILDCSSSSDAPSIKTELFGPVLSVQSFDEEEEAVEMANDTHYGLAAGVFTSNLTRAHRMMRQLHAGVIWVNTYKVISPMAPFGGFGLSGHGREGGIEAVLDYTTAKAIWLRTSDSQYPNPFGN